MNEAFDGIHDPDDFGQEDQFTPNPIVGEAFVILRDYITEKWNAAGPLGLRGTTLSYRTMTEITGIEYDPKSRSPEWEGICRKLRDWALDSLGVFLEAEGTVGYRFPTASYQFSVSTARMLQSLVKMTKRLHQVAECAPPSQLSIHQQQIRGHVLGRHITLRDKMRDWRKQNAKDLVEPEEDKME